MAKIIQILFFLLPILGFSQKDTIARLYTFGAENNDSAEDIEVTEDGGYVIVGSNASNSSGNTDAYLLKMDSLCNYEWSFSLGKTNNDWGYGVKQTFDKGFIVITTSNSYGNGGYDVVLMKRDSLGKYQWTKSYGGDDWDFGYSIAQTYDSGYVFCGETYNNTNGKSDIYIVKTNFLGDTLWTKTIGGNLSDKGNSIIETSDSNIVVVGYKNTLVDSTQAYLLKLSPSGDLLWDSLYGGVGYEEFNVVTETNSGNFVLAGTTNLGNDKDYYVLRTDKEGVNLWQQILGSPGDESCYDIIELINGDLLSVGYTMAAGAGGEDGVYFKLNSGGSWIEGGTFGGVLNDNLKKIGFGSNGQLVFAGATNSYGNGKKDALVICLDTLYPGMDTAIVVFNDMTPLSINNEKESLSKITMFPNPIETDFFLKIEEIDKFDFISMSIVDISGRTVYSQKINQLKTRINVSQIIPGVYFLKIKSNEGFLCSGKKIIKL